jgi:PTH2 family peptidyl-tRNA hydrolase
MKQVIVIRKDLKMRRGKECVQSAHASLAFLLKKSHLTDKERKWVELGQRKICLQVSSEESLLELVEQAKGVGLEVNLIQDSGLTEFDCPTYTCLAIGPDEDVRIDPITQNLKLY